MCLVLKAVISKKETRMMIEMIDCSLFHSVGSIVVSWIYKEQPIEKDRNVIIQ